MSRLTVKPPFSFWVGLKADPFAGEQVAGSVTNLTEDSHDINRSESATLVNSYVINWEILHDVNSDTYTASYTSSNESVATINSQGVISVISDGEVVITVTITSDTDGVSISNSIPVYVSTSTGASIDYIQSATGSAGKAFNDSLETLISSSDPATAKPRFSSRDLSTKTFTRNEDFWGTSLSNLSAISPNNSRSANKRSGTAITKRHIICAAHYPLYVGDTIDFVSNVSGSATATTRTIKRMKMHPLYAGSSGGYKYDIQICLLDSDLPSDIDIMEILPNNSEDYTGQYGWMGTASVVFDKEQKGITKLQAALISGFNTTPPKSMLNGLSYRPEAIGFSSTSDFVSTYPLSNTNKLYKLNEEVVSGDSGSPNCFVLGSKLVLIGVNTFPAGGTYLPPFISDINQLITDVDTLDGISTGYTVTECDLSAYPTY